MRGNKPAPPAPARHHSCRHAGNGALSPDSRVAFTLAATSHASSHETADRPEGEFRYSRYVAAHASRKHRAAATRLKVVDCEGRADTRSAMGHGMLKVFHLATLSALALAPATAVTAATVTHSKSVTYVESGYYFQRAEADTWHVPFFDPALGELQSVTLKHRFTWQFDAVWTAGEVTNGNSHVGFFALSDFWASVFPSGYTFGYVKPGTDPILQAIFEIPQGSGPGSYSTGLQINEITDTLQSDFLGHLIGPTPDPAGYIELFASYTGYGGECLSGDPRGCPTVQTTGFFRHDASVTYVYRATGAVPAPTMWSIMILGFGLAGANFRRLLRPA